MPSQDLRAELRAVAFPRLDENQMAALGRCVHAKLQRYQDGQKPFETGDRDFKFFVIKSGRIDIVDESGDEPRTIATLGPGSSRAMSRT